MRRLLLLLLLLLPATAADFESRFQAVKQDWAQLAQLVAEQPGPAEELFRKHLGTLLKQPQAEPAREDANLLARALLLAGKEVPTHVLKSSRLLYPDSHWSGSPLQDAPKTGSTPAERADHSKFEQRFKQLAAQQNWSAVGQFVFQNPNLASAAFEENYRRLQEGTQDQQLIGHLNALARAMLVNGNHQPAETLKSDGHLYPASHWNGTALEDDERLRNRPKAVARNLESKGASPSENAEAALKLAISLGNLGAAEQLLPEVRENQVLRAVAYESAGLSQRAWETGRELPSSVYLQCCMAMSARRSYATDRLLQHLTALENELQEAVGEESKVARFLLESQRFWLRSLKTKPSFEELLEAHQKAWSHLEELEVRGLEPGYGRWLTRSASVWLLTAQELSDAEARDYPYRAQLHYLIDRDFERIESMNRRALEDSFRLQPAEPTQFRELWNPEFFLGLFELRLEFVGYYRQREDWAAMRRHLDHLKPLRLTLAAKFQEANLAYQSATLRFGPGSPLLFSWFEGHVLRLLGLYHAQWAQFWLHQEPWGPKPAYEAEAEVSHARQFQQQSKEHFGLDDWRWPRLAYHIQQKPEGWSENALRLLKELETANPGPVGRLEALRLGAEIKINQGQSDAGVKSLEQAVKLVEEITTETGDGFRQQYARVYHRLAQLYLQSGRQQEAFELLGRGAQVDRALTRGQTRLSTERERRQAAAREMETARGHGGGAVEEKVLARTRAEFYAAMKKLRAENPTFGNRLAIRPVGLSRIQKALPPGTAILQYFPAPEALYIFVADRESLQVHQLPVSEPDLTRAVRKFRRGIQSYARGRQGSPERHGRQLYSWLVAPVAEKVADKELLVFIPTGSLFYLPFPALSSGDDRFLIQDHQVAVVTRASDLLELNTEPRRGSLEMLALGNPDGSLPGAEKEVESLKKLFPNLKPAARDRSLLSRLGKANTLHLATHGVVNRREPLESYLVLADQERLTLNEISAADLNQLRLVTLSACETAISSERGLQGEVATLADSFSFAGVSTLVASLWKVSDESTRQLMLSFYGHLKNGKSSAEALSLAQRELLNKPETAHPYHWAAFTVLGDWR